MKTLLVAMLLASTVAGQRARADEQRTRFLVPIFQNERPGAFGSRWVVDTWFYYAGPVSDEATIVPMPFVCRSGPCPFGMTIDSEPQPLPVEAGFHPVSAVLFHVDREHADKFTFTSRVRDLSREADSAGTDIPVVNEERMSESVLHLLNVPVAAKFRNMLRVYALPEVADPEVEVRYFRMPPQDNLGNVNRTPLRTERLQLRTHGPVQGFWIYPSLTEVPDFQRAPELAGETALWIDVVPVTAGLRIWAFVSVTSNDTQQVTLVTPVGR